MIKILEAKHVEENILQSGPVFGLFEVFLRTGPPFVRGPFFSDYMLSLYYICFSFRVSDFQFTSHESHALEKERKWNLFPLIVPTSKSRATMRKGSFNLTSSVPGTQRSMSSGK